MARTSQVLQFRIELLRIQPLIWRRIQIPGDYTFWDLHVAIQSAFAWNDSHLHEFKLTSKGAKRCFGLPTSEDVWREPTERPLPDWEHRVIDHLDAPAHRIAYAYDFGDDWQHVVIFEEALSAIPGKKYPRCAAGERAGPPDDCGGNHGYESLLEILRDPDDEEYKSLHRWAASIKGVRKFDPEAFDEHAVKFANPAQRLKRMLQTIGQ